MGRCHAHNCTQEATSSTSKETTNTQQPDRHDPQYQGVGARAGELNCRLPSGPAGHRLVITARRCRKNRWTFSRPRPEGVLQSNISLSSSIFFIDGWHPASRPRSHVTGVETPSWVAAPLKVALAHTVTFARCNDIVRHVTRDVILLLICTWLWIDE
jgi:hypothetical protein